MHPITVSPTRRALITAGATSTLLMTIGCSSSPQASLVERFTYKEKVGNIFFVPKRSKLIVLGERYHYLFDDQRTLDKVISASFAKDLAGSFGVFVVVPSDRITGSYQIRTRNSLIPSQKEEAKQLGFIELPDGRYELAATITGERFTTVPLSSNLDQSTLSRTYTIDVAVLGYNNGKVAPSSPLVQAADSIASLLLMPVFALTIFFLY